MIENILNNGARVDVTDEVGWLYPSHLLLSYC